MIKNYVILLLLVLLQKPLFAETIITVLNFDLVDTTFTSIGFNKEQERLKSIKPLLASELVNKFNYKNIDISDALYNKTNHAKNYIFEHPEVAATLGKEIDVHYVIVGKLHKPSFLFAYLMLRVIDVKKNKLIADYVTEAKGQAKLATRKAVINLAKKVNEAIKKNK